jgi:hypothetical protein
MLSARAEVCNDLVDRRAEKGECQIGPVVDPLIWCWTGVTVSALSDVVHDLCGSTLVGEYVEGFGLGDQSAGPQRDQCPSQGQQGRWWLAL